jgi:nucleotide-binding universal stress UspA family protein
VFDERVARALDRGDRTPEAVATESEALAADVRALADSAGVPTTDAMAMGFSTRRKAQHPGSVVLDCADDAGADFVVVPREPVEDAAATLAKAAEYVVAYADQPVLSV